jgi:hypothetical protein
VSGSSPGGAPAPSPSRLQHKRGGGRQEARQNQLACLPHSAAVPFVSTVMQYLQRTHQLSRSVCFPPVPIWVTNENMHAAKMNGPSTCRPSTVHATSHIRIQPCDPCPGKLVTAILLRSYTGHRTAGHMIPPLAWPNTDTVAIVGCAKGLSPIYQARLSARLLKLGSCGTQRRHPDLTSGSWNVFALTDEIRGQYQAVEG